MKNNRYILKTGKTKLIFPITEKILPGIICLFIGIFCSQLSYAQCPFPSPPDTITVDQNIICDGSYALLSAVSGSGYTYQWKKDGIDIPGATSVTYAATVSGIYICQIDNICVSVFTNYILITVVTMPAPVITADGNITFCDWAYNVLHAPTGPGFSYQWKKDGIDIPGADSVIYETVVSGNYSCQVTNVCGSGLSNTIVITVIPTPAPVITALGPTNFCAGTGSSVTMSVNPAPPGAVFSYQWKSNGQSMAGETSTSCTVTGSSTYTCVVSNVCGNIESNGIFVYASQIIPDVPSMIVGNAKPCPFTSEVYSVNPSPYIDVSFNWIVPAGAIIASGQGTNVVTVDFNSNMTSGKIQVAASTVCGSSNFRSKKIGKNNNCGARLSASSDEEQMDVMVYPNPADDHFNLILMNETSGTCKLIVHDFAGRIVEQMENISSGVPVEFGKRLAAGFYQVEIVSSEERKVFRVAKNH